MVNIHVEVTAVPKSETYLDPNSSTTITYPNDTGAYPNNAYSLWEFVTKPGYVFEMTFQHFDVEPDDSFFFGDGVDKFTNDDMSCSSWDLIKNNQQSTTVTSKSSSIKLVFTSGFSGSGQGIGINLTSVKAKRGTHQVDIVKQHFLNSSSGIPVVMSSQNLMDASYLAHCSWLAWTFETRAGRRIRVEFLQFDFADGREFFVVGDGRMVDESANLARFTGTDRPSVVTSVSNAAWIMIEYDFENCCHHPVFEVNISEVSTSVTSIHSVMPIEYPTHAENTRKNHTNRYELWDLQAPGDSTFFVEVLQLDINPATDVLYLGDGGNSFSEKGEQCSSWTRLTQDMAGFSTTSRHSAMTLLFSSSSFSSGKGFSLQFKRKSFERDCIRSAGNYSFDKNRNMTLSTDDITRTINLDRCIRYYWTFHVSDGSNIRISFQNFALRNDGIFLLIGDGVSPKMSTTLANFSGGDQPSDVITVSNSAWLMIHDSNDRWCETSSLDLSLTVSENHGESIFVDETVKYITFLFNDKDYKNNYYYIWDVRTSWNHTITARVSLFQTESDVDFVYIGDGVESFDKVSSSWRALSGDLDPKSFPSNTSSLKIIFSSNGHNTSRGFVIELQAVKKKRNSNQLPGDGSHTDDQDGTEYNFPGSTSNKSYLMYILVGASGVVSLILLSICLRWVHVKLHRRRLARLEENNYYEEAPTFPALPPRNKYPLEQEQTLDDNTYESVREYRNTLSRGNDFKYGSKDSDMDSTITPEVNNYTFVPDPLTFVHVNQKSDDTLSASDASDEEFVIIDQGERTSYIHTKVQIKADAEETTACVTRTSGNECLDDVPSSAGCNLDNLSADLIVRHGSRRSQSAGDNEGRQETRNGGNFIPFKYMVQDPIPDTTGKSYPFKECNNLISSVQTNKTDESGYMVPTQLPTDDNLGSPLSTMLGLSQKKPSLKSQPPRVAKKTKKRSSTDPRGNIPPQCLGWEETKARAQYLRSQGLTKDVDRELLQHTYMGSEDLELNNHVTRHDGDPEVHGETTKPVQMFNIEKGSSSSPDESLQHIYHDHGSLCQTQHEDDLSSFKAEGAVTHDDRMTASELDGFGYLVIEDNRV